jgi:hypothetical protein
MKFVIKANEYKYPSLDESKQVVKDYPKISRLGFKYKDELESLINNNLSLDEAMKHGNLYWWDNCLLNRLGALKKTYIYALTNYNRGFIDEYSKCSHNEFVNRILFDYYAEIFYYYFFSARDIIAQIIRLYFNIAIKEKQLRFDSKFIDKIPDINVKNSIKTFYTATKDASEFRNSFAHRFTPTLYDNRSYITEKDGKKSLNLGDGDLIESKRIVENIKNSVISLSIFIHELKELLIDRK